MIRRAAVADVEALAALRFALWPDEPIEVRRAETEANVARVDGGLATFVAEDAGEVVAFAEVSLRHDYVNGCETSPVVFLEGIYVRPEHRGRGSPARSSPPPSNGAVSKAAASSPPTPCSTTTPATASTPVRDSRKPSGSSTFAKCLMSGEMDKLDLKKARKDLFTAPLGEFAAVTVPRVLYLIADGHGDPNASPEYPRAVEALYSTAYALKFACKAQGRDFVVPPLEGLWSAADPSSFVERRKDEWDWTMMIMVPDFVDQAAFEIAREKTQAKLGELPESLRLEALEEGLCLQALHIGSYDQEGPLLARLHDEVMPAGGYAFAGRHHEIYLGDPRKTAPEELKTILRQPVRKA